MFFPIFRKWKLCNLKINWTLPTSFFSVLQKCKIRCHVILFVTNWCKLTKGSISIQKYVYGTKKQLSKKKKRKSPFFIVSRFRSERKWKKILQQKNFVVRKKIAFEKNFWARKICRRRHRWRHRLEILQVRDGNQLTNSFRASWLELEPCFEPS